MDTIEVQYRGDAPRVIVPTLGREVGRGETVAVPKEIGEALCLQDSVWASAPRKTKKEEA